jgi:hypothetical protein
MDFKNTVTQLEEVISYQQKLIEKNDRELEMYWDKIRKISTVFCNIIPPPPTLLSSSEDEESPRYQQHKEEKNKLFDSWLDEVLEIVKRRCVIDRRLN